MNELNTIENQLNLEDESRGLGISRYRKSLEKSRKVNGEADTTIGNILYTRHIPKLTEAINELVESGLSGRASKGAAIYRFIQNFEEDYEVVAFIIMRCLLQSAANSEGTALTGAAQEIGSQLGQEIHYRKFEADAKGLYITLQRHIKKYTTEKRRRNIVNHAMRKFGLVKEEFSQSELINVGTRLTHLACEVTGMFEVTMVTKSRSKQYRVKPVDSLLEWIESSHSKAEILSPLYMPMCVKPNDWDSTSGGGYLGVLKGSVRLVRGASSNYDEDMKNTEMPEVYEALNHIQSTKWRINRPVLDVMEQLWEEGAECAGLPSRDNRPLPAKPADIETNEEALNDWKSRARAVYDYNAANISKRVSIAQKIRIARKFQEYPEIYFPWSLDWRGRAYPIPSFINPQSDDSGKGLLQFAEGKPLGEDGAYWLAIHIANLFGVDKVSFDDRLQWVMSNQEALLDSAMTPLDGNRFWMEADDPFQALAACFEWCGYCLQGNEYVSHISINVDGSCNGLQNFSAMMRDEEGGKFVNLLPSENPEDIYNEVKLVVERKIAEEASNGNEMAKLWLGKASRKICKRPVMTLPYGATKFGMRQQVREEIKKIDRKQAEALFPESVDMREACAYMGDLIYTSIEEVVHAAKKAMDWLQEVARIMSAEDVPVHWTTPTGFVVNQKYSEMKEKRVRILLGTQSLRLTYKTPTQKLNKRKQAAGIAPNFVHSMDASHMMKTILKAKDNGITELSFIHDSYGTHAGSLSELFYLLRDAFVEMYSDDILLNLKEELEMQLPKGTELPDIPDYGDLDLSDIYASEYFFA